MSERGSRVLLVDDDESFRRVQEYQLDSAGYQVTSVADGEAALEAFREGLHDLVVTDVRMPGLDGLELLARVRAISPDTPVVMITAQATIETAVEAMKQGAFEFLTKPFPGEKLRLTLERAREFARLQRENRELRREVEGRFSFENLIGSTPPMKALFDSMELAAPAASTVLIFGETGTGKELVARAIHYNSPRKEGSFVTVNCGAIPETLMEAELFGYRRGAFTGAETNRKGKFETADGGTLFLDEVGEIPLALQPKILRVLQSGEVDRLGSDRPVRVDVRCRDPPRPGATGIGRGVPRGLVLPAGRDPFDGSSAARPPRRHPAARRSLPAQDGGQDGPCGAAHSARSVLVVRPLPLARQRSRAGEHHRAARRAEP